MNSRSLTKRQAKVLDAAVRPMLGFLTRLKRRMEQRGFPPDDKLFVLVVRAHDAMYALSVELHYASCAGKAGRPEGGDDAGRL